MSKLTIRQHPAEPLQKEFCRWLSFAIARSSVIGLGGARLVTVMETTDLRDFDDPSRP